METEVERLVAGIWREILRIDRLSPEDNFFDRGGSSLLAVKVAARILDVLGVEIAIRDIFRHPTLAQFIEVLTSDVVRPIFVVPRKRAAAG